VICGMAMGYAQPEAIVNTFRPPRIALEDYAVFLDWRRFLSLKWGSRGGWGNSAPATLESPGKKPYTAPFIRPSV